MGPLPHTEAPPGTYVPQVVEKPWGREIWWANESAYAGKILAVREGARLSLQYHQEKAETLFVMSGKVIVRLGDQEFPLDPGYAFTIAPGTIHRFTAVVDSVLLEVSTPHLTDVVRVEDDFNRPSPDEL